MGCRNETCALSFLPITDDEPIVCVIVKRSQNRRGGVLYLPAYLPLFGTYIDDYGSIEVDTREKEHTHLLQSFFGCEKESVEEIVSAVTLGEMGDYEVMFILRDVYDHMMAIERQENRLGERVEADMAKIPDLIQTMDAFTFLDDMFHKELNLVITAFCGWRSGARKTWMRMVQEGQADDWVVEAMKEWVILDHVVDGLKREWVPAPSGWQTTDYTKTVQLMDVMKTHIDRKQGEEEE